MRVSTSALRHSLSPYSVTSEACSHSWRSQTPCEKPGHCYNFWKFVKTLFWSYLKMGLEITCIILQSSHLAWEAMDLLKMRQGCKLKKNHYISCGHHATCCKLCGWWSPDLYLESHSFLESTHDFPLQNPHWPQKKGSAFKYWAEASL